MSGGDAPVTVSGIGERELVTDQLPQHIDPENFTPRLIALLSNALVWRESQELRRRFELGTNDWRIISALALRPGASSTEISEFIEVNKAVISKSVNTLAARGLIALIEGPRGSRPMFLTGAGARMHDDMFPISMRGQELILEGMSPTEVAQLNTLLRRMIEGVRNTPDTEGARPDKLRT